MGLISTLFGRRQSGLSKAPRRTRVEPLEERRLLAADVLLGSVYLEESLSGQDDNADVFRVSFVGGAEGTTLDRFIIDGDKAGDGPSVADVFFDSVKGGAGSFEAVDLTIDPSSDFTVDNVSYVDGGTAIAFDLTGFEAGEELVFRIDVDEYGLSRGELNSNAFAEGGEFEGSTLRGEFSAPGFVDLDLEGTFHDAFDGNFASAEAAAGNALDALPGDNYDDPTDPQVPVRTAGAVANAPQIELARLSGYVYHDRDDDGLREPGASEEAIPGVTVALIDPTGLRDGETTTTDANGYYEFIDLTAGTYSVREVQPDGWFDGKDTAGSSGGSVAVNDRITGVELDFGERSVNNNFGELLAGSIAGRVHADRDGDCDFDDPDILLSGVTIELTDSNGVVTTTTTDDQGRYSFTGLRPGEYQVREIQPAGYFDGGERAGTAGGTVSDDLVTGIVIGSAVAATQYDFCEHVGADLSGYVYHDRDDDGLREPGNTPGEEAIAGVTIRLLAEAVASSGRVEFVVDGVKTSADEIVSLEVFADSELGAAGDITIRFYYADLSGVGTIVSGDITGGFAVAIDSATSVAIDDIAAAIESISAVAFVTVSDDTSFGRFSTVSRTTLPGSLTLSGGRDAGDTGHLAVTDANGYYEFTNLDAGSYSVREIQPFGWIDGKDTAGSNGGVVTNDLISAIVLAYGDHSKDNNFGELQAGSISGRVHASRDGDCDFDDPDILLSGVTIELIDSDGNVTTTTTDDQGRYSFNGLRPGEYEVREIQPAGYYDGGERAGNAGGVVTNDRISQIALRSQQDAINYDFCEHVGASLSGYVYHDRDDDGLREPGNTPSEEAIAGVTVVLVDPTGARNGETTTTDTNGYYEFTNLDAGTYSVREVQPVGWFDGKDTAGSNGGVATDDLITGAVLGFGDRATDYNFGELRGGSISGRVHASRDGDCDFEDPDILLAGVTIELIDSDGNVTTTTTDAQGRYSFVGLRPGSYTVRETQPEGYYDGSELAGSAGGSVTDDQVSGIVIGSSEEAAGYDFCEHVGADLSGYVYHDRDDDGIREPGSDPGEEGIPQVTLKLLREDGSDTGERAVTDANGFYKFTNLDAGKYRVMEIHPDGWIDGKDTPGSEGGIADNPGDMIRTIMLNFGDDATEYNFGELLPASIAGSVYSSPDGDCENHTNATPISGVVIELYDSSGEFVMRTTTNADGEYLFEGLKPGSYSVYETQPTAYFDGGEHAGLEGGTVSDDAIEQVALGSGVNATDYDFCELPVAALSGRVFIDGAPLLSLDGELPDVIPADRDGTLTAGDTLLPGVTVKLVNGSNGLPFYRLQPGESEFDTPEGFAPIEALPGTYLDGIYETVTDANGYYEFSNLPSGSYAVVEVQPDGLFDWIDTPGTTGGIAEGPDGPGIPAVITTSRVVLASDTIALIPLLAGEHSRENDFSELDITPGQPPQETPDPPPPYVPPTAITPGNGPTLLPFTPPERPIEEIFGGSSGVGYTWHLSVINAGKPRELAEGVSPLRFASKSTDDAWSGAERDASELRKAKWQLLASDIEGDELSDLVFGSEDAIPVAGDWDGDGITDIGVFIGGDWYLDLDGDGRWSAGDLWAQLGSRDDLPVTGDWDGDGKTDIGIYGPAWPRDPHAIPRDPGMPDVANYPGPIAGKAKNVPPTEEDATSGARLLAKLREKISGRRIDRIDHVFHFGTPGDAPVVGDWNGDGIRTIGVFRDGIWSLDTNGDGRLDDRDRQIALGAVGDKPIVGDYNGDGIDDLGVYRGGQWLVDPDGDGVLESLSSAATDRAFATHEAGEPVVGDWDGDGRDEPALFQPGKTDGEEPEIRVSQRNAG